MDGNSVDRGTRAIRPFALCGERIKRGRRTYTEEVEALLLRARYYGGDDG